MNDILAEFSLVNLVDSHACCRLVQSRFDEEKYIGTARLDYTEYLKGKAVPAYFKFEIVATRFLDGERI